jgi:hypothetical protein
MVLFGFFNQQQKYYDNLAKIFALESFNLMNFFILSQ